MELGAFSVSLTVRDLLVSRDFYQQLGFTVIGGDVAHSYLILANGPTVIGLFQGMFPKNMLTFNPGWAGPHAPSPDGFTDVREIAATLAAAGLTFTQQVLPEGGGPGYISLEDPDGNPILLDQHR